MNIFKKLLYNLMCISLLILLAGCTNTSSNINSDNSEAIPTPNEKKVVSESIPITDILYEQLPNMVEGKNVELPEDYVLLDYSLGDLNKDDAIDIAVAIEQSPGLAPGSRVIYIYMNKNGTYELSYTNHSILLNRDQGGVFGDPYGGISIENGKFKVSDYAGSAFRWGHVYTFEFSNSDFILSSIEVLDMYVNTSSGTVKQYDLTKGVHAIFSLTESDELKDNGYNNLLIYSGNITDLKMIAFDKAYAWQETDFKVEPNYPMPPLGNFEYGFIEYNNLLEHTPEDTLSLIQEKYYPDMKKIQIPTSDEIIGNYSTLMGYNVPTFYFSDDNHILCYYQLEIYEGVKHNIIYKSKTDQFSDHKYYKVSDGSGEVILD